VRTRAAIETLIADLPAEWQAIDVRVNNAGLALGLEPAHRASVEDWEDMDDTNNKGLVYIVTDIEPGLVGGTEFSNVRFKGDDAKAGKTYENTEALTPEDVTEAVWWVATLPKHVNINTLEMMPVSQSFAGLSVHRQG
ncbi:SDR family NAD(P)-dependent oxidoreductase, partial [Klebsiella quasipneumoniae]|uniref:SDR family NAD(P)-dependent oxidoreductase n=1 Tax=Klebsiella quasipneumoniae TaxID=1463165 RepID=UPI00254D0D93